jgi:hypothetical protein
MHRVEEDLGASIKGKIPVVELAASAARKLTNEERQEVV